jgi:hypothetical protein
MPLSTDLEKKLEKQYEAAARIDDTFRGKDISFVTNDHGDPITLFIGKRKEDGSIQGERYVRRLQYGPDNTTILKSHWDLKGKVTRWG